MTIMARYYIDGRKVIDRVLCTTKYWFRAENLQSVSEDIALLNKAYEEKYLYSIPIEKFLIHKIEEANDPSRRRSPF